MEGRAGLPHSPAWLQRSGLRGGWAAGVGRCRPGAAPGLGLGGQGRASERARVMGSGQARRFQRGRGPSFPLTPGGAMISRSVLPPSPRRASPLPLRHLCGFKTSAETPAAHRLWSGLSASAVESAAHPTARGAGPPGSVCSLQRISLEGVGTERGDSPRDGIVLNHPSPTTLHQSCP